MRLFLTLAPGGAGWVCTASAAETVWSFDFGQGIGDECAVGSFAEGAMRDKDGFDETVEEHLDALPEEEPASGQYCLTPRRFIRRPSTSARTSGRSTSTTTWINLRH